MLHLNSDNLPHHVKASKTLGQFKVAWSATMSCSDLLENDIKCVYWQDNPTCQVSIFSKKLFLSNGIFCNPKFPLTYCVKGFWHSAKFSIFAVFLKAWLIYKSSFKGFVSCGWTWFLFCLFAKIPSSSSSSFCCGAGDYKISPCTSILGKCGDLVSRHIIFIIPQQTFDVRLVGGTWTSRSPFAMRWYIESISSVRLFFRETKDMPKKTQLSLPYIVYKWLGVSHGIYDGVWYMVSPFNIEHNTVGWCGKSIDFAFHVLW